MPRAQDWNGESRILVYGVTGSGKTTLARKIGERLALPWHEVDQLTWEPNWTVVPLETQIERIEAIVRQDKWVLDTAYAKWRKIPLARAEIIVGLDYPRWVSLSRLIRRCCARMIDGKPICNGNRERLRNTFSRDSIIRWHFDSFARKRSRIVEWEAAEVGPPVLRLRSPREAERLLLRLPVSPSNARYPAG